VRTIYSFPVAEWYRLAPIEYDYMTEITRVLSAIDESRDCSSEQLLPLVYDELRRLAAQRLKREAPGQTIEATALVHEAYVRLVENEKNGAEFSWNSRGHFFAAAAEAMRRILVERARHKNSLKAGGNHHRREMADVEISIALPDIDLIALDMALSNLESTDKRRAQLVKLRFFAGLTIEEAALALGISTSTADNDWAYARCWLRLEIDGAAGSASS
jgi:RNA polymerase sigma factor (TIGR02999 family)